jgi:hypothetical protein
MTLDKIPYRKRRDLMLKKHSSLSIFNELCNVVKQNGIVLPFIRGRPCEIPKHKLICYILFQKCYDEVLEEMELHSEIYLGRHYDHGTFSYHYKKLSYRVIETITWVYERLIMQFLKTEIILHIFDSTAISTSVREERTRQGTRNKEKITQKLHTLLGYDPPNQIVIVEGCKATTNKISDNQGALEMLRNDLKGYSLGDSAYETYELTEETEKRGLFSIYKPQKRKIRKTLSAKKRARDRWNGNPKRLYKEIRGLGEVLYGAATRAGLIKSECRLVENQHKDGLVIALRQNMLTYLRLKALTRIIRKTRSIPSIPLFWPNCI